MGAGAAVYVRTTAKRYNGIHVGELVDSVKSKVKSVTGG